MNDSAPSDRSRFYSVAELANEFSLTSQGIRFYEESGLIAPARVGRTRVFNYQDRARLVLIQRLRYKDALDLIASLEKPGKQLSAPEKLDFDFRRARVLMLVGRRDEAVQVFNSVADRLRVNPQGGSPVTAVRSLIRIRRQAISLSCGIESKYPCRSASYTSR